MEAASISQAEKEAAIKAEKEAESAFKKESGKEATIDELAGRGPNTIGNVPSDAGASNRTDVPPGKIAKTVTSNEQAAPTEAYKPYDAEKEDKKRKSERAPITTLAQLREERKLQGKAPTTAEVAEVKKLEAKTMEELSKKVRISAHAAANA